MGQWKKNIWHDPVWSKVISGIILFALGLLVSFIKGCLSETETIHEAFFTVFTYRVNIWLVVAVLLVLMIASAIVNRIRRNSITIPVPPFVNDFTWGVYQGQKWTWRWQWSNSRMSYYIVDLNIVCPVCKQGLLTEDYYGYKCGKCGADVLHSMLNTEEKAVKKQVLEDARERYRSCSEYIGTN